MTDLDKIFGSMAFNDAAMLAYLPEETYLALKTTIDEGQPLDIALADSVAEGMKRWAVERGATHYTHWFQPQTGVTAEKHESFLSPASGGAAILSFSGKALIKGESDASSFPSGGLRATFEARGYTAWDPTSYAFIKEDTLCIPTAFCSYGGEALDKKTPLLRSMKALERQALRLLKVFGTPARRVYATAGAEQEYFLITREAYSRRQDLQYTGRTLFGAMPPKGQELDDFYYAALETRVSDYMKDLNRELWKLGILAKTEHNEAAPSQHELAPMFSTANVACDQNQLMMEMMDKVAKRHGLACLLHEKPFRGVNGSGKHVNWSLATDDGRNLLDPGSTPSANAQFLTFFCAVIRAVDEFQELLRLSAASCGNDRRLGANEAPPAIISVYVGDELDAILRAIASGAHYDEAVGDVLRVGVDTLPPIPRDSTDRNRTATFAFTGNRFEFRMPGSSASISDACTVLNTIVADSLGAFADELEGAEDLNEALTALLRRSIVEHRRIVFNGNGDDPQWVDEANRRGLAVLPTTADAVPHLTDVKVVNVMTQQGVYTRTELAANRRILLDAYCKKLRIEALTMLDMARREILPAAIAAQGKLAADTEVKARVLPTADLRPEKDRLEAISRLSAQLYDAAAALEATLEAAREPADYKERVIPAMMSLRQPADEMERLIAAKDWPFPTYGQLLYQF